MNRNRFLLIAILLSLPLLAQTAELELETSEEVVTIHPSTFFSVGSAVFHGLNKNGSWKYRGLNLAFYSHRNSNFAFGIETALFVYNMLGGIFNPNDPHTRNGDFDVIHLQAFPTFRFKLNVSTAVTPYIGISVGPEFEYYGDVYDQDIYVFGSIYLRPGITFGSGNIRWGLETAFGYYVNFEDIEFSDNHFVFQPSLRLIVNL